MPNEPRAEHPQRCGYVVDYDDSIGGEGEITCGAPLTILLDGAACLQGHGWAPCDCGGRTCKGWKVVTHVG